MSRRRYVSTDISVDARINALAERCGPLAVLLYTWMIPHAGDDGSLGGDPLELKLRVVPGLAATLDEIRQAVEAMVQLGLLERDDTRQLYFRPAAFYRYQTYVRPEHRRAATEPESPRRAEDQRESAENRASVSSSPSPPVPVPVPVSPPTTIAGASGVAALAMTMVPPLSAEARTVLECWRQAHGKRSPPRLNPTQTAALEQAVVDLGVERLGAACRWSAEQGVTEFIKAIRAARTRRQRETQPVRPAAPAPPAGPRPDRAADADWQERDWNAELAGES